jgi:hypothetical protein
MNTFFELWKKTIQQDGRNTNNTGISNITEDSDPSHYLAHDFNNQFLNIKLKFSTMKVITSIIKPVKPKIHVDN